MILFLIGSGFIFVIDFNSVDFSCFGGVSTSVSVFGRKYLCVFCSILSVVFLFFVFFVCVMSDFIVLNGFIVVFVNVFGMVCIV